MNAIIIYESTHHGNTKKLVDAISERYGVPTVSIENAANVDLTQYDAIGLASGIAFSKFYERMEKFAKERVPGNKNVFFIYTCGINRDKYTDFVSDSVRSKLCDVIGTYGCLGFDTFGPFKLIGGIAKGHPTQAEIDAAVDFYGELAKLY